MTLKTEDFKTFRKQIMTSEIVSDSIEKVFSNSLTRKSRFDQIKSEDLKTFLDELLGFTMVDEKRPDIFADAVILCVAVVNLIKQEQEFIGGVVKYNEEELFPLPDIDNEKLQYVIWCLCERYSTIKTSFKKFYFGINLSENNKIYRKELNKISYYASPDMLHGKTFDVFSRHFLEAKKNKLLLNSYIHTCADIFDEYEN